MKPQLGNSHPPQGGMCSNSYAGELGNVEPSQRMIPPPTHFNVETAQSSPTKKPACVPNCVPTNSLEQRCSGMPNAAKSLYHRSESIPQYQLASLCPPTNNIAPFSHSKRYAMFPPAVYSHKLVRPTAVRPSVKSSVEELVIQQLQRNEMDGILVDAHPSPPVRAPNNVSLSISHESQYATRLIPPYSVWNVDDVDLVLFAMYRVLLQSRPDAPNDMVIQIPLTCSTLLPSLLQHFIPSLLQDGNAVKQAMKQLVYSRQQVDLDATPFLLPEVIRSLQGGNELDRGRLLYVLIRELDTPNLKKEFYLKVFLRCLFFVFADAREAFARAFSLFFEEQVERCRAFEQSCRIGELSQLVILARSSPSSESASADRAGSRVFAYHRQLDFFLEFCARNFIRPFPPRLFHSILRLFRTSIILSSFNSVSKFLYTVVLTQPELAATVARFFVRSWPWTDSSREVLYLRQVECTFVIVPEEQQLKFFALLFSRIRAALQSTNRFVSLQCIQFLSRVEQNHLYILSNKMIQQLTEVLQSLQAHWCETIRQTANSCMKSLLLKAELRSSSSSGEFRSRCEAFTN